MTEAIEHCAARRDGWADSIKSTHVGACPNCASLSGQWRGYRERKDGKVFHRWWCRACGKWTQHQSSMCTTKRSEWNTGDSRVDALIEHLAYDCWIEAHEAEPPTAQAVEADMAVAATVE